MKRPVKKVSKKGSSSPQTVNFFSRFDPDSAAKTNFENTVLVYGFFTGQNELFPLHPTATERLCELAFSGNSKAAESLVKLATHLSLRIAALEKMQPKIMSEIARHLNVWPVVANTQPALTAATLTRLNELGVAKDIGHIDSHFRKAAGCDDNYPARRWAKTAVSCINETRFFQQQLILREEIVVTTMKNGRWQRGEEPEWVSHTKDLPNFSQGPIAQKKWAELIRQMIRQQLPDFELRDDWSRQRNSCKQSGRNKRGEIQNAILDDIISALKTIAPDEMRQSAENFLPEFGK